MINRSGMIQKTIVEYNNELSRIYDEVTSPDGSWTAPSECFRLIRPHLNGDMTVLDLGIGTGLVSTKIAEYGCKLIGIDAAPEMLSQARRKLPSALLLCANIEEPWPLSKHTHIDMIVAVGVLEFVPSLAKVFITSGKHLKLGGLICFTYEELLPNSPLQRLRRSPRGALLYKKVPRRLSFPVFRQTFVEVKQELELAHFTILHHHKFVAYHLRRSSDNCVFDVTYRIVLAQRVGPSNDREV
ncbi:MAG: class I SAM-dependent methyltransferase [Candidatus Zambryskibacteria bacterium]|nr:class I SAM-dependent methyltransferase [Candidatus Zambryskibacteria bacterium]